MDKSKVTCSFVSYKTDILQLNKAIESIPDDIIIYIVDNSPTSILKKVLPLGRNLQYIFNNKNLGFGPAHNIAIRKAIEHGSTYHLVLNPDIEFGMDVIIGLTKFMDNNLDIGLVMPKVLYPDKSIQYLCKLLPSPYDWIGRRFSPFKKYLERRNEVFELRFTGYNEIMDIPYLSGCFMFMRTSILKEVGLFDENIFMYCEDTDLSRRIYSKSRSVFYPKVTIYHEFQKGPHKSFKLLWYNIQSSVYYFNKWGWFFDEERNKINRKVLNDLGFKK